MGNNSVKCFALPVNIVDSKMKEYASQGANSFHLVHFFSIWAHCTEKQTAYPKSCIPCENSPTVLIPFLITEYTSDNPVLEIFLSLLTDIHPTAGSQLFLFYRIKERKRKEIIFLKR